MNKLAFSLLIFVFPIAAADEPLPSVDAIYNHFISATGGKAAWEARHSQVQHATIEFPKQGIKGAITIYEAAPDKYLAVTELAAIGKIAAGSNGAVAWENMALTGPRIKKGVEKAEALRDGVFNSPLYWKKLYPKGETAGSEAVEGHDCYKVVLTPREGEGKPITEFFDKKSGLMVKTTTTAASPFGEISAEIVYDDYRKDGDLLSPFRVVTRAAEQEYVVQVQSVEVNPDLPQDTFNLPAEVTALLNKTAETKPTASPENRAATSAGADSGKLAIYMAGHPVASETYTVKTSDDGVEIDGSGSATLGTIKVNIERFDVRTNSKYEPLEAIAKAKMGQIPMSVDATFSGGQAKNQVDTGQGPQTKMIPVHPDAVVVNANLPLYPWTLLAMRASFETREPQQVPVYVLGQAEVPGSVVFKGREPLQFSGKSIELNHLTVSGATPQGQPISLDLWVDDHRKLIKIAVPSQGVEAYQEGFEPKGEPARPQ